MMIFICLSLGKGGSKEVVLCDNGVLQLQGQSYVSSVDDWKEFILEETHSMY